MQNIELPQEVVNVLESSDQQAVMALELAKKSADYATQAQVHATLALVEATRALVITNNRNASTYEKIFEEIEKQAGEDGP